ncbi:MAG TPA: hypothetical protein VF590_19275 [Isosphaeraceae bacterium]|jgi:hypothetical protein
MSTSDENLQALNLVQALLGSVTTNLRAAAIDCTARGVTLVFVLEQDRAESRDEIADVVFEFEALQTAPVPVETVVLVDRRDLAALGLPSRLVFARKE